MFLLPSRKEKAGEWRRRDRVCKFIFNNVKQKMKFMSRGSKRAQQFETWLWQSQVKLPKATFGTENEFLKLEQLINAISHLFSELYLFCDGISFSSDFSKVCCSFSTMINYFSEVDELCIVFWLVYYCYWRIFVMVSWYWMLPEDAEDGMSNGLLETWLAETMIWSLFILTKITFLCLIIATELIQT